MMTAYVPKEELDAAMRSLDLTSEAMTKDFRRLVNEATMAIHSDARRKAPAFNGLLRNSIRMKTEGKGLTGVVSVDVFYGPNVEFGTKKKTDVPSELSDYAAQFRGNQTRGDVIEDIYKWCEKKGIPKEAHYPIAMSIIRNGIRAQPYLFPAFKHHSKTYLRNLKKLIKKYDGGKSIV